MVILSEQSEKTNIAVNNFCRKHNVKFISTDCFGLFGRVFNDFGDSFEVLDKNGEELQDCMIEKVEVQEDKTLIQLLKTAKHNLEDGDIIQFTGVDGMKLLEGKSQPEENKECKSGSIDETLWKVQVKTAYSYWIGDTRMYSAHEG